MSAIIPETSGGPLVSVGMPVYNEGRYLARTIEGILAQDYPHFELIISDNASTDDTQEVVLRYAAKDRRIRYHRNETNVGAIRNFNCVFELAAGEFFAWAGGHDLWQPTYLSRCLEPLLADESVVLAHAPVVLLDPDDRPVRIRASRIDTRNRPQRLPRFNIVLWSLVEGLEVYGLMRLSALKQTGLFRDVLSPDFVLLLELSFLGAFASIPGPSLHAREHIPVEELPFVKLYGRRVSRWEEKKLLFNLIRMSNSVVWKYVHTFTGKLVGTLILLLYFASVYRVLTYYTSYIRPVERVKTPWPRGRTQPDGLSG